MVCRGCGNSDRHVVNNAKDSYPIEEGGEVFAKGFGPNQNPDPSGVFVAQKKLSYEDLTSRKNLDISLSKARADAFYSEMTEAMKRVHIEELVDVVNCQKNAFPGLNPGQAIRMLKDMLDRGDFSFISSIYPNLKDEVGRRYSELEASCILLKS